MAVAAPELFFSHTRTRTPNPYPEPVPNSPEPRTELRPVRRSRTPPRTTGRPPLIKEAKEDSPAKAEEAKDQKERPWLLVSALNGTPAVIAQPNPQPGFRPAGFRPGFRPGFMPVSYQAVRFYAGLTRLVRTRGPWV